MVFDKAFCADDAARPAILDSHHGSSKAWNGEKMLCLGGLGGLHGDNIFKKGVGFRYFRKKLRVLARSDDCMHGVREFPLSRPWSSD